MRLLFLCKRRPQGRDLLTRPYGRFFYLPYHLAQLGHEVTILLLDYKNGAAVHCHAHGLEWYSLSLGLKNSPIAYLQCAEKIIETQKPDWIIGFSDIWYGIFSVYLGKRYGVKTLIDAYDNYESYIPWLKPLQWLWRYCLRQATALSAAGPQLAELMSRGRVDGTATVIPMAADPFFQPLDGINLRERFNLPTAAPLIGYCGSLYKNRGVEVLFQAIEFLLAKVPRAKLIISGRRDNTLEIPGNIRHSVIHLGYLPDEQMPFLLNAMDILLVLNLNSAFGNFSYPVKLYEAMRCGKPVVASDTDAVRWILRDHPECLAEIGNPRHLADRLCDALSWKKKIYKHNGDWERSGAILRDLLEERRSVG